MECRLRLELECGVGEGVCFSMFVELYVGETQDLLGAVGCGRCVHCGVASGHVIRITSVGKIELSEIGRLSLRLSRQNCPLLSPLSSSIAGRSLIYTVCTS
jgi:hypothetical protein